MKDKDGPLIIIFGLSLLILSLVSIDGLKTIIGKTIVSIFVIVGFGVMASGLLIWFTKKQN